MIKSRRWLLVPLLATGCVNIDANLDDGWAPAPDQRESMEASVSFGADATFPFFADDVVASMTTVNGKEELVVSGISGDRTRSLAFVIDSQSITCGEPVDMALHGAVYMEMGPGGTDFIFDGNPQGELFCQGELEPGSDVSARFEIFIPTYDRDGEASVEFGVGLEGSFSVHLLEAE